MTFLVTLITDENTSNRMKNLVDGGNTTDFIELWNGSKYSCIFFTQNMDDSTVLLLDVWFYKNAFPVDQ